MSAEQSFIEGFTWVLPSAFIDALARCRFEEGDTLYDTKDAYGQEWSVARQKIQHSVQVRFPSRGPTGANEDENAVFMANWESPVHVDLYKYPEISLIKKYETTQGRLYAMLWHGDLSLLEAHGPIIKPPAGAKALINKLEAARYVALEVSDGEPVFAMPYDHVGRLTHAKFSTLRGLMQKRTSSDPAVISCSRAGIPDSDLFSPTAAIAVFPAKGMSPEELEATVKEAFYKPSEDAKKPKFYLNRHGIIFSA